MGAEGKPRQPDRRGEIDPSAEKTSILELSLLKLEPTGAKIEP
jgi:hypothetical protein